MKKLLLHLDDDVYEALKSEFVLKSMCGNIGGGVDAIVGRIIMAIEKEEPTVTIVKRVNK